MRSKEKNMDLTSTENEAAKKVKKADKWADKPAMEVRDLHFSYGKNKVLKGVSLKIEEGKITTIMGANGCGKSTLFSLMTKNLYPRKGNIFLKGKNIQNLNLKEFARKVAIVHQINAELCVIIWQRKVVKLGLFTIKSIWVYLKQEILELQLQKVTGYGLWIRMIISLLTHLMYFQIIFHKD